MQDNNHGTFLCWRSTFLQTEVRLLQYAYVSDPRKIRNMAFQEVGTYTSKPDVPPDEYRDAYDPVADMCGLFDKFQLVAVTDYLFMNGKNTIYPVSIFLIVWYVHLNNTVHSP